MAGRDTINALGESVNDMEQVKLARFVIKFILDMTFVLVMPFLRRNFGERFFSMTMVTFMVAGVTAMSAYLEKTGAPVYGYMTAVIVLSAFHLLVIFLRNRKGEQWHTRYEGDFLPFFRFLPKAGYWMIEGFYEPLFVLIAGGVVSYFTDPILAGVFYTIAIFMVIRSRYHYRIHKEQILDERDNMIESECKMQALQGKTAKETKGFIIKGAGALSDKDKLALGKKILPKDEFEENFPEAAKITMSKDEMRKTT